MVPKPASNALKAEVDRALGGTAWRWQWCRHLEGSIAPPRCVGEFC